MLVPSLYIRAASPAMVTSHGHARASEQCSFLVFSTHLAQELKGHILLGGAKVQRHV